METRRFPVWVAAVKLLLDVVWWVGLVAVAIGVPVLGVAAVAHVRLRISVPAFVSLPASSYRILGAGRDAHANLHDITAQLTLSGSTVAVLVALAVITLGAGLGLLIVYQLRRLLAELRTGRPFTAANARRATLVGVALGISELLRATVLFAGSWWTSRHLHATGVGLHAGFPVRVEVLVAGVLLVLFAEVFRLGALLQHDHDLTI